MKVFYEVVRPLSWVLCLSTDLEEHRWAAARRVRHGSALPDASIHYTPRLQQRTVFKGTSSIHIVVWAKIYLF